MKTKCASLNNSSQNSCQVLGDGGWVVSEVDEAWVWENVCLWLKDILNGIMKPLLHVNAIKRRDRGETHAGTLTF